MSERLALHPDRLSPADARSREIARGLYESVRGLPIVSPHGHTDPSWFAANKPFANPTELLVVPDHYLLRMLYSQGVPLERLGVAMVDDRTSASPQDAWRCFGEHYHLFRATPSRLWLDWVFAEVFGVLVHRETWGIGGDLEQHPARLAEVDRTEVEAVYLRRYPES